MFMHPYIIYMVHIRSYVCIHIIQVNADMTYILGHMLYITHCLGVRSSVALCCFYKHQCTFVSASCESCLVLHLAISVECNLIWIEMTVSY